MLGSLTSRKSVARRLLGLPAQEPDPTGVEFVPTEDGMLRMERLPEDEVARRVAAWHAEGRRGALAEQLAHAPSTVKRRADRVARSLRRYRAARELSRRRTLRYTSFYIHPTSGCTDIEGYFDLGNDLAFGLQLIAAGALPRYAAAEWDRGEFVSDTNTILGYGRHILVPGDELTPDSVAEALRRWHADRFEFVQGHWTAVENAAVHIDIDLHWQTGEAGDPHVQAIRS